MLISNRDYVEQRVELDGLDFEACRFQRCTLVYEGRAETALNGNEMEDCEFVLEGAAGQTMRFLVALADANDEFLVTLLRSMRLNPQRLDRLAAG
jgi:hypothetical protein